MTRYPLLTLAVFLLGGGLIGPAQAAPAPVPTPTPTPVPVAPYVPNLELLKVPPPLKQPPPSYIPADVPERPLTAEEACLIALRHQPNVDVAAANVLIAQGRTQQTRAGLNPTVTLTSTYTAIDTDLGSTVAGSGGGNSNNNNSNSSGSNGNSGQQAVNQSRGIAANTGLSSSLTARQLIFDFEHTLDQVRQQAALEKQSQSTLTQTEADLVLSVKQAFYTFVQDEALVGVQADNIKNQQEHLRQSIGLYKAGTGLPSDVVQAQAAVADAIEAWIAALNTADSAQIALAKLMGIDPRTPLVAAPSSEPVVDDSDVDSLVNLALQVRPEVREAVAAIEAGQYGLRAAHTTDSPNLSAQGILTQDLTGGNQINTFTSALVLQWPVIDGGATRGLVTQAKGTLQIAQDQLRLARSTVISDVATGYLNLHNALQAQDTVAVEVASAKESLRLQTGRYSAGIGTALEVLDAEQALLTAQTNQVNDQAAVDNARANLLHAIGTPPPAFGAPLTPLDPLVTGVKPTVPSVPQPAARPAPRLSGMGRSSSDRQR